jgi:hypothetical protein
MKSQKCALCSEEKELKLSHIVPKFVFRYLSKTSDTGKFRDPNNIKKRIQDGPKYKLLCSECEQMLSESEKYFAEKLFKPFVQGKEVMVKYDHNLQYFIKSAHWRFLLTRISSYKAEKQQILKDIEIALRSQVQFEKEEPEPLVILELDYHKFPKWSSHHIYSINENTLEVFNNDIYSVRRMVTCDLFFYNNRVIIYSYYCGLILCSVFNCRKIDYLNLKGHLIRKKGRFKLKKVGLNNIIVKHLLMVKDQSVSEAIVGLSNDEQDIIRKQIEKSIISKSKATKNMHS